MLTVKYFQIYFQILPLALVYTSPYSNEKQEILMPRFQNPLTLIIVPMWDTEYHSKVFDYSRVGWNGFYSHVKVIFWAISFIWVSLLLLLNFIFFILRLMYKSLIENIGSSLTHLLGFLLLFLQPVYRKTFPVLYQQNIVCFVLCRAQAGQNRDRSTLENTKLMLIKQGTLPPSTHS